MTDQDRESFRRIHEALRVPVDKAAKSGAKDASLPLPIGQMSAFLEKSWEVFSETVRYQRVAERLAERFKEIEWEGVEDTCLFCGQAKHDGHLGICQCYHLDGRVKR